jgi:hypothetical protein
MLQMLTSLEIPDPFTEFRINKYAKQKSGYRYDFFSGEWDTNCGACNELLNAPTRKILTKIRLFHTRNECLGGY